MQSHVYFDGLIPIESSHNVNPIIKSPAHSESAIVILHKSETEAI